MNILNYAPNFKKITVIFWALLNALLVCNEIPLKTGGTLDLGVLYKTLKTTDRAILANFRGGH